MSYSPVLGNPKPQYEDSNGAPYVGMRLFFYAAGTSTKQNTQTTSAGSVNNTNPIVIDANGYPTGGVMIYGDDTFTYKVVAAAPGSDDPPTSSLWSIDNVNAAYANGVLSGDTGAALIGFIQEGTGAVATTMLVKARQHVSIFDFLTTAQIASVKARDSAQDCRAGIQAALDYCLSVNGTLEFPPGQYAIKSAGATQSGLVCGLLSYNQTGSYQYNFVGIRGAGIGNTKISCADSLGIDVLFFAKHNGSGFEVQDMQFEVPGGSTTKDCLRLEGNSLVANNIRTSGGEHGIYLAGEANITNHTDEYSVNALYIYESYWARISNSFYLTSNPSGVVVYGTYAGSGGVESKALSGIEFVNCSFGQTVQEYTCVTVDIEAAACMDVSFTNCFFGSNGFSTGAGGTPLPGYGVAISEGGNVSFTGCQFALCKYGNTVANTESAVFTNCTFVKNGFIGLTATAWAVRDLAISGSSRVSVIGCTFKDGAGTAIYSTSCKDLNLIGNTFINVSNGGLNALTARVNLTSATVGDENIYFKPDATSNVLKLTNNHFDAPSAYSAGKYGLVIDCTTAVPSEKNVIINSNTVVSSSFGANYSFSGGGYDIQAKALWTIFSDQLVTSEWTTPAFLSTDFTSDSGTWTVGSSDVATYKYKLQDKTMTVAWEIRTTDVTGTPDWLQILIPNSKISKNSQYGHAFGLDNGTRCFALAVVDAAGTNIKIHRINPAFVTWTATGGAADTYVYGNMTFEIQ